MTGGYICAKVRRFHQRVSTATIGCTSLPCARAKGQGRFTRVSWNDALDRIAERLTAIRDESGGEAILPLCYGGSNGYLTQDYADAILFRRLGASRLPRTVCAAPTGAANQALYGKMASVGLSGLSRGAR